MMTSQNRLPKGAQIHFEKKFGCKTEFLSIEG